MITGSDMVGACYHACAKSTGSNFISITFYVSFYRSLSICQSGKRSLACTILIMCDMSLDSVGRFDPKFGLGVLNYWLR